MLGRITRARPTIYMNHFQRTPFRVSRVIYIRHVRVNRLAYGVAVRPSVYNNTNTDNDTAIITTIAILSSWRRRWYHARNGRRVPCSGTRCVCVCNIIIIICPPPTRRHDDLLLRRVSHPGVRARAVGGRTAEVLRRQTREAAADRTRRRRRRASGHSSRGNNM